MFEITRVISGSSLGWRHVRLHDSMFAALLVREGQSVYIRKIYKETQKLTNRALTDYRKRKGGNTSAKVWRC